VTKLQGVASGWVSFCVTTTETPRGFAIPSLGQKL
jgi:hypothetical protein